MEELKISEGIIINENIDEVKKVLNKKIAYIPLWKWLLRQHIL